MVHSPSNLATLANSRARLRSYPAVTSTLATSQPPVLPPHDVFRRQSPRFPNHGGLEVRLVVSASYVVGMGNELKVTESASRVQAEPPVGIAAGLNNQYWAPLSYCMGRRRGS